MAVREWHFGEWETQRKPVYSEKPAYYTRLSGGLSWLGGGGGGEAGMQAKTPSRLSLSFPRERSLGGPSKKGSQREEKGGRTLSFIFQI